MRRRSGFGYSSIRLASTARQFLRFLLVATAVLAALTLAGCNQFNLVDTLGTAGEGGPLELEPSTATVVKNGSIAFVARGGDQPYRFEMAGGLGSINRDTGVYTAPSVAPASVTIRVVDDAGEIKTASITVTGTSTGLALSPATVTVPPGGQINFIASGGSTGTYSFSLTANGSGSPTVGSTSGVYVAGNTTGIDVDTVEVYDGVDTALANITVSNASTEVDYEVSGLSLPPTGTAGQPLDAPGAFTITNLGTSNGADDVFWYVYLSQDGTLGSGDYLVDQGSIAGLDALDSAAIDVTGLWPAFTGGANFFVRVFAQDDSDYAAGVNETSAGTNIVAPDVDYIPSAVTVSTGLIVGGAFSGTFDITNTPTTIPGDDGSALVYWYAYISTDGTFDPDLDPMVDSGTVGALDTEASTTVPISGTWSVPATTLFVSISAIDDQDPGNNLASTPVVLTAPLIDYQVTNVSRSGSVQNGENFSGSFILENVGTSAGTETVYWTAYISADATLSDDDLVIETGTNGPLASSGTVSPAFTGTWPTTPAPPVDFFLIVEVANGEDTNSANDWAPSAAVTITPGDVENEVGPPAVTGGSTIATEAFTGAFDIFNNGADDGLRTISWNVYISEDAVLDGSDTLIDSGSTAPLPGGGGSTTVNFGGYWPATPGSGYRLIAEIGSTDPVTVSTAGGGANTVLASGVDYSPIATSIVIGSAGAGPGEPLSGTFDLENIGSGSGLQTVTWAVYASLDTTLSAGDILVDAGSTAPLAAGAAPVQIPYAGDTPLRYGTYYVLIQTTAGDDVNGANDLAPSGSAFTSGIYDEAASEPNDSLADAFDLGVTFEPGMEIRVNGNTTNPGSDTLDYLRFNTGTASLLRFAWYSDVSVDLDLYLYDGVGTPLDVNNLTEDVTFVFLEWVVDTPGADRVLRAENFTETPAIGDYRILITAE